jgi:hypothetical protein
MSQVPPVIVAIKSTIPAVTWTFHLRFAVEPFKSGDDTSVNAAPALSQVAYT